MNNDIESVYLSQKEIAKRVKEMAQKINEDYVGKDILLVPTLKGSFMFASDLIRNIKLPCDIDFIALSSYGNTTETSGKVKITKDLTMDISNKHLIIIEDIIDSGVTMDFLINYLKLKNAASVEIATLLNKPARRKKDIEVCQEKDKLLSIADAKLSVYKIDDGLRLKIKKSNYSLEEILGNKDHLKDFKNQ